MKAIMVQEFTSGTYGFTIKLVSDEEGERVKAKIKAQPPAPEWASIDWKSLGKTPPEWDCLSVDRMVPDECGGGTRQLQFQVFVYDLAMGGTIESDYSECLKAEAAILAEVLAQ
jgi:hypothetical protein